MSTLLRLYLPAAWPERQTQCEWELLGKGGTRLHMGNSEPRHWPVSDRLELILSAEQCLYLSLPLPKSGRARTPEVVGYALEEHLLGDVAAEHFVIGDSTGTAALAAPTAVRVISKARLQTLISALRPFNRVAHRLISELQLPAASQKNDWIICLKAPPACSFVRQSQETGFVFDLPATGTPDTPLTPPLELRLALHEAEKSGKRPTALQLLHSPGTGITPETAAAWQTALGIPIQLSGEYIWRNHPGDDARNLLTGEFAPPRSTREGWGAFRPALLLAGLALATYTLYSFGEWFWLNQQKDSLRQQMTSHFRTAFPQTLAIVDPVLQMQRQYDQLRRERGQPGSTDFLPLLATTTETGSSQGRLRRLNYEDGRLEAVFILKNAAEAERLRETLSRRGLTAILRETRPVENGQTEATFAVRSD